MEIRMPEAHDPIGVPGEEAGFVLEIAGGKLAVHHREGVLGEQSQQHEDHAPI